MSATKVAARCFARKSLLQHVSAAALMTPAMAASIAAGGVMLYSRPGFGQSVVSIDTARTTTVNLATEFPTVMSQATVNVNATINVTNGFGISADGRAPNNPQTWDIVNNDQAITSGAGYDGILTATGGVNGAFDPAVDENFLFLDPVLVHNANSVVLSFAADAVAMTFVPATPNQRAVIDGLLAAEDSIAVDPDFTAFFLSLGSLTTTEAARSALDSLAGEIHGSLQTIGLQQERDFHDLLRNRNVGLEASSGSLAAFDRPDPVAAAQGDDNGVLATLGAAAGQSATGRGHGRGAWATVYGGRGQLSDDGNASTTDHALAAGAVGFDAVAGEHLFVGGAVGYGRLDVDNRLGDNADAASIRLGGYGHYHIGKVTVRATASIARAEVETSRVVAAGAVAGRAEADYNRLTFLARGEVARAYKVGAATVEPYVGLEGGATRHGDFTESGVPGANLDVEAETLGSIQSVIGGRLTATLRDAAMVIVPHISGEWRHEFADTFGTVEASFVGVPASRFTTRGVEPGRDTVSVGGGVELGEANWRIFLDYQADLRQDSHNQTLRAGAKLLF